MAGESQKISNLHFVFFVLFCFYKAYSYWGLEDCKQEVLTGLSSEGYGASASLRLRLRVSVWLSRFCHYFEEVTSQTQLVIHSTLTLREKFTVTLWLRFSNRIWATMSLKWAFGITNCCLWSSLPMDACPFPVSLLHEGGCVLNTVAWKWEASLAPCCRGDPGTKAKRSPMHNLVPKKPESIVMLRSQGSVP